MLKGPQGPLYGSGALGGVYQMVPAPPSLADLSASLRLSDGAINDGGMAGAFDRVVNMPVVRDRLALRLVGYLDRQPGWIDEGARRDVNRGAVAGGRLGVASRLGKWRIDAIGTVRLRTASTANMSSGDARAIARCGWRNRRTPTSARPVFRRLDRSAG